MLRISKSCHSHLQTHSKSRLNAKKLNQLAVSSNESARHCRYIQYCVSNIKVPGSKIAITQNGYEYSYASILRSSDILSSKIRSLLPSPSSLSTSSSAAIPPPPPRVALFAQPGPEYVAATWAIWRAGCIVVPLATSHPPPELDYVIRDADVSVVIGSADSESKLKPLSLAHGAAFLLSDPVSATTVHHDGSSAINTEPTPSFDPSVSLPLIQPPVGLVEGRDPDSGALIIYTSGTTGRPKGALHTHGSLAAQVASLAEAWKMNEQDRVLHVLPLHHIHGIVNGLYLPLAYGGTVDFMSKFTPSAWWTRIKGSKSIPNGPSPPTVFMGVPPMYNYILAQYDKMDDVRQAEARRAVQGLRLAISGSSACPVPILERWRAIAGDYLLERFGMTEIGMAVSNPLAGPRLAGTVGPPLPLVTAKLSGSGELLVKGPTLFKEYWRRPEATQEAFDEDGFFKTGDASSMRLGPLPDRLPYYVIEGRLSVDIIKCLGFKVSALHVESVIMENPSLAEIAVVGVKDDSYGERIVAIVAFSDKVKGTRKPSANELREFSVDRLAPYQVPRDWHVVDAIPRNAMGKVNKKDLVKRLIAGEFESLK